MRKGGSKMNQEGDQSDNEQEYNKKGYGRCGGDCKVYY